MEYTINNLSKIAGVSTRTLRYYDQIGLLRPVRVSSNGYRIYGQGEVNRLQQILFYRELGFELEKIKEITSAPDFDASAALAGHLTALIAKQNQLFLLIENVKKTISEQKGELAMSDNEKFEGFKKILIEENEQKYGTEIREKYGDDAINASNAKLKGMTQEQYTELEQLSREVNETLNAAFKTGDPAGELAQKACALHKKWLCFYWQSYSKEAHKGLGEMYVIM